MTILLQVSGLKTRFHTSHGIVHAVNGVSFQVHEGETLGIVGESGCGKTASMLSILGLLPSPPAQIESGEVFFQDVDLLKLSSVEMRRICGAHISMVFQDHATSLNPVLTIGKQIAEPLEEHLGMNKQQSRARTVELLTTVGIPAAESRIDDYPHQLSGGMRQRVMLAIALSCLPKVLIADEPTTALDVTVQAQIIELVQQLKADLGMSIIWITHDLGVIAELADRVAVMYAGFVVEEAPVRTLFSSPRHPYSVGLLDSVPRIDGDETETLSGIEGKPPNMLSSPRGCPFAPRCSYVFDRCWNENPNLAPVNNGHSSACWWDITTGTPRT
jgi:oligopeptide transport system ATP-binding protein